jgi:putative ABC transport system permease protein
MALAIILLARAGVMIRSFLKIHTADMGVKTANVLAGSVDLPASRYPTAESKISFFDRLTTRLETMPGVESVATAENLPSWGSTRRPFELAGSPPAALGSRPILRALKISRRISRPWARVCSRAASLAAVG